MYRLNPFTRNVLITSDEVIANGPVGEDAVSPGNLNDAIVIAEERFIKKAICKAMYYDFRDKKNVLVTISNKSYLEGLVNEGNVGELIELQVGQIINAIEIVDNQWYVKLWHEFLWKITAECVVYIATPTNWSQYKTSGEMQNNPKSITNEGSGAASIDLKDVKWKMDKILMDRINPLMEVMHEWICDNKANFPLYTTPCPCDNSNTNGVSVSGKTGWIHNIYNDGNRGDCCKYD